MMSITVTESSYIECLLVIKSIYRYAFMLEFFFIFFFILFRQMSKETSIEIKEFLILDQCFWYAFIGMGCLLVI